MGEIRALAVDDNLGDREAFERLAKFGVPCTAIAPPLDLSTELLKRLDEGGYDVLLLDFCLDRESGDDARVVTYRGGTAAAMIREQRPDLPIVLVTKPDLLMEHFERNPALRGLFDAEITKTDLHNDRKGVAGQIEALVSAFRAFKKTLNPESTDVEVISAVLAAEGDEAEDLVKTLPVEALSVQALVRWLRQGLVRYPGPLGDELETCTRLGVTVDAFEHAEFKRWLEPAAYRGPFSAVAPRWWRRRLHALASAASEGQDPGLAQSEAIAAKTGCSLKPTECGTCGNHATHGVCVICREPVDPSHSLDAVVDDRPRWVDAAVVCFQCIMTGRDEGRVRRYAPGASLVLNSIRSGGA